MSLQNLFGELGLEGTLQKIAQYLEQIASNQGRMYPDSAGRTRTMSEGGTITTVSTVSGVSSVGGYNAQYDQYGQCMIGAEAIRNKITVS